MPPVAAGTPGEDYPLASAQLRAADPAGDLARAEAFWASGLGLRVLERVRPYAEGEHELVVTGWPGAAWPLGLAAGPDGQTPPAPTVGTCRRSPSASPPIPRSSSASGTRAGRSSPPAIPAGPVAHRHRRPDGCRLVHSHQTWP